MERQAATPAELARVEDPGANAVSEAAEVVPAESVRLERNEKVKPIQKSAGAFGLRRCLLQVKSIFVFEGISVEWCI